MGHLFFKMKLPDAGARSSVRSLERAACVLDEQLRGAMKTDYLNAKILSHRANLQRYATLLATQLTELEREYLHQRIEEERAEVASLEFARAAEAAQAKETVTVPSPLPPHASPPAQPDS
jgi:hypothetical protein